jgi:hypothetical protein
MQQAAIKTALSLNISPPDRTTAAVADKKATEMIKIPAVTRFSFWTRVKLFLKEFKKSPAEIPNKIPVKYKKSRGNEKTSTGKFCSAMAFLKIMA